MGDIEFGHLYVQSKFELIEKLEQAVAWVKSLPDDAFYKEQSISGVGTIDILEPEEDAR